MLVRAALFTDGRTTMHDPAVPVVMRTAKEPWCDVVGGQLAVPKD